MKKCFLAFKFQNIILFVFYVLMRSLYGSFVLVSVLVHAQTDTSEQVYGKLNSRET